MATARDYHVQRGEMWNRLVIVKDERTRRPVHPSDCRAAVQTPTVRRALNAELTKEWGVQLTMSEIETWELPDGAELDYDVVVTVDGRGDVVAQHGKLLIETPSQVTPRNGAEEMELRFKQHEDFFKDLVFREQDGTVVTAIGGYMQAVDEANIVAIDLRWFSSTPDDAQIAALPEEQRGYVVALDDYTVRLHVSNLHPVPAGEYPYDLFIQEELTTNWTCIQTGVVVVEPSVSIPPYA